MAAERLPVRTYTSSDGLILDGAILQIMQDSRGFLWFITGAGISRFDGQSFQNHDAGQGLPSPTSILETCNGEYWLGTGDGLVRYNPSAATGGRFQRYSIGQTRWSNSIATLADDGAGGLWVGTQEGLYRVSHTRSGLESKLVLRPEAPPHLEPDGIYPILFLLRDSRGALWATGHYCGVYRIRADGSIEHYTSRDGVPGLTAGPFLEDHLRRMWLATAEGLVALEPEPKPGRPLMLRRIETRFGSRENLTLGLGETPDGHLWIASALGLLEFDGRDLRRFTRRNGLAQDNLWSILPDRDGNLWVGTNSAGVMRISRKGLTSFDESDGMGEEPIASVVTMATGELIGITRPGSLSSHFRIHQFTGGAPPFRVIEPRFPSTIKTFGWGNGQILLRDHLDETWIATHDGLARFHATQGIAGLNGLEPSKVYTMRDGLRSNNISSLFEDARGDIWIGVTFPAQFGMQRWIRNRDRFEDLTDTPGAMPGKSPLAFAESRSGTVWVGELPKGLSRFRHGRFRSFGVSDGLPDGSVRSFLVDSKGTVWGAASGGLIRVEDPDSDQPRITTFTEAGGLSSNDVTCVAEDLAGRIYAGTFKGVSVLDPSTGEIQHVNTADGLTNNLVTACTQDRGGQLWFGTGSGLSRLSPGPRTDRLPPVRIASVLVSGRALPISDLGETEVNGPSFSANQNSMQIAFAGINFSGVTRYRYRLDGSKQDWETATQQKVDYAELRPGEYRFLVEAIGAGSQRSSPASFAFTVLPPMWQRWWFVLLVALALSSTIYAAWRFRLNQLLEVERLRMRIATDLHDDIGSALSQIGLLSEVARSRADGDAITEAFARIASVSRETSASMADIVWTINPQRDSLGDLSTRIRRFAGELFSASDIECAVVTPESDEDLKLGIDTRRQLLLVAKEAMHNVVRHAHCTRVSMELRQEKQRVVFRIGDNGEGFDPEASAEGHGIASMRSRAERLGGALIIQSGTGGGTQLEVRIPI
jgi:signal transduction histidine kinase/ligand-binding sensor domain-containing protein